jgi:hypothetical protein
MCGTAHDRHRSRSATRWTGIAIGLVLVLPIAPTVLCADELATEEIREIVAARPRATPALHETVTRPEVTFRGRLDDSRRLLSNTQSFQAQWFSNIELYLERVSHGDLATYPGRALHEEMYYEGVNQATYNGLRRATGRALEEYFFAETGLDRIVENFGHSVGQTKLAGKLSSPRALSIDFGISSYMPEVQLKPRIGDDMMRIRIRAAGSVSLAYRTGRWGGQCWISARVDPVRETYTFAYSLDF